jgi:hypothetical protein
MEYYVVGHDTPEPLYDAKIAQSAHKEMALMFAGIGDARHLHYTLMQIQASYDKGRGTDKTFHFTLVDCKPAVIARDMVIMLLIHDLSEILKTRGKESKRTALVACLYFTYLEPILPGHLGRILTSRIQRAVDMLEGRQGLPSYLDVPVLYRPPVIAILNEWKNEVHPLSGLPLGCVEPSSSSVDLTRCTRA